jgi:hypothetical protein
MPLHTALHWATVIISCLLILSPIIKILRRVGFSEWWALLALVPIVNIAALWFFAYMRWPNLGGARRSASPIEPRPALPSS